MMMRRIRQYHFMLTDAVAAKTLVVEIGRATIRCVAVKNVMAINFCLICRCSDEKASLVCVCLQGDPDKIISKRP